MRRPGAFRPQAAWRRPRECPINPGVIQKTVPQKLESTQNRMPERKAAALRPGPGRPTRAEAEGRSRALLETALDLFLRKGFDGTTIREITQAVGMAKRTVSSWHGSKLSLFKAALKRAIDDWVVPEHQLRAAESADLEATLLRIAHILVANYLSPASIRLLRIANAESARMPEISTYTYEQCTRPQIAYLADLLRRSRGEDLPDAERYALSFLSLIASPVLAITWGVRMSDAEIETSLRHAVGLFMRGLPIGRPRGR